jgi:hypothetical protein
MLDLHTTVDVNLSATTGRDSTSRPVTRNTNFIFGISNSNKTVRRVRTEPSVFLSCV